VKLAGFEEHFEVGKERRKGKEVLEGRENERKERDGNPPLPRN